MEERRKAKFRQVASCRQPDLTVVLENVTDMHNIGAVLRSCDSVGILEIFILNTEPHLAKDKMIVGKRTSAGARKWVDIHYYTDVEACCEHLKSKYGRILGTHLDGQSTDLYDLDLTMPTALLFGNAHCGISAGLLENIDGNFIIPQVGMVESLNISVACAVTLYETYRQRKDKGFYTTQKPLPLQEQQALAEKYISKHAKKVRGKLKIKKTV